MGISRLLLCFPIILSLSTAARAQWSDDTVWPAADVFWILQEHVLELHSAINEKWQVTHDGDDWPDRATTVDYVRMEYIQDAIDALKALAPLFIDTEQADEEGKFDDYFVSIGFDWEVDTPAFPMLDWATVVSRATGGGTDLACTTGDTVWYWICADTVDELRAICNMLVWIPKQTDSLSTSTLVREYNLPASCNESESGADNATDQWYYDNILDPSVHCNIAGQSRDDPDLDPVGPIDPCTQSDSINSATVVSTTPTDQGLVAWALGRTAFSWRREVSAYYSSVATLYRNFNSSWPQANWNDCCDTLNQILFVENNSWSKINSYAADEYDPVSRGGSEGTYDLSDDLVLNCEVDTYVLIKPYSTEEQSFGAVEDTFYVIPEFYPPEIEISQDGGLAYEKEDPSDPTVYCEFTGTFASFGDCLLSQDTIILGGWIDNWKGLRDQPGFLFPERAKTIEVTTPANFPAFVTETPALTMEEIYTEILGPAGDTNYDTDVYDTATRDCSTIHNPYYCTGELDQELQLTVNFDGDLEYGVAAYLVSDPTVGDPGHDGWGCTMYEEWLVVKYDGASGGFLYVEEPAP